MTYEEFIEQCRAKNPPKPNIYHHIILKSCGGPDDSENRIYLSILDHWLAHYILARENPDNEKFVDAFKKLGTWEQYLRKQVKQWMIATNPAPEAREKMGRPFRGKKLTPEQLKNRRKLVGELNGMYGKKHSEESIQKMRESHLGHTLSEESKKKLSNSLKGKNKGRAPWNKGITKDDPRHKSLHKSDKCTFEGKKHSEESKKKMSEARKAYWEKKHNSLP